MKSENTIISEHRRPFWQLLIAAFCFTLTFVLIIIAFWKASWTHEGFKILAHEIESIALLLSLGVAFSSRQTVHIDLLHLKIRPTVEVGPIKIGKWQALENLEYISIFLRLKSNGSKAFEVNLWYNRNKHLELYERDSFSEAYSIAFKTSDYLNIDLLDSTESNNAKWIDLKASKAQGKIVYDESA